MNQKDEKLQLSVKARKAGDSTVITIPKAHRERLNIEIGDEIKIQAEKGQHGSYASFWNHTKQEKEDTDK